MLQDSYKYVSPYKFRGKKRIVKRTLKRKVWKPKQLVTTGQIQRPLNQGNLNQVLKLSHTEMYSFFRLSKGIFMIPFHVDRIYTNAFSQGSSILRPPTVATDLPVNMYNMQMGQILSRFGDYFVSAINIKFHLPQNTPFLLQYDIMQNIQAEYVTNSNAFTSSVNIVQQCRDAKTIDGKVLLAGTSNQYYRKNKFQDDYILRRVGLSDISSVRTNHFLASNQVLVLRAAGKQYPADLLANIPTTDGNIQANTWKMLRVGVQIEYTFICRGVNSAL